MAGGARQGLLAGCRLQRAIARRPQVEVEQGAKILFVVDDQHERIGCRHVVPFHQGVTVRSYEAKSTPPRLSRSTSQRCTTPGVEGAVQSLAVLVAGSFSSVPVWSCTNAPPVANQDTRSDSRCCSSASCV